MDERERLSNRGEHAEPEHVDFEETERIEIVLVPGHDRAIEHAPGLDGRDVHERLGRKHEAAHVDREMTRKPFELARERDHVS